MTYSGERFKTTMQREGRMMKLTRMIMELKVTKKCALSTKRPH